MRRATLASKRTSGDVASLSVQSWFHLRHAAAASSPGTESSDKKQDLSLGWPKTGQQPTMERVAPCSCYSHRPLSGARAALGAGRMLSWHLYSMVDNGQGSIKQGQSIHSMVQPVAEDGLVTDASASQSL